MDFAILPGQYDEDDKPKQHIVQRVIPALFAFGTDVKDRTEIERYKEVLAADTTLRPEYGPPIKLICVAGRGCWVWKQKPNDWLNEKSGDHEEVLKFLSIVTNSYLKICSSRGFPRLGHYIGTEGT
jgi:hypothetical protein